MASEKYKHYLYKIEKIELDKKGVSRFSHSLRYPNGLLIEGTFAQIKKKIYKLLSEEKVLQHDVIIRMEYFDNMFCEEDMLNSQIEACEAALDEIEQGADGEGHVFPSHDAYEPEITTWYWPKGTRI